MVKFHVLKPMLFSPKELTSDEMHEGNLIYDTIIVWDFQ